MQQHTSLSKNCCCLCVLGPRLASLAWQYGPAQQLQCRRRAAPSEACRCARRSPPPTCPPVRRPPRKPTCWWASTVRARSQTGRAPCLLSSPTRGAAHATAPPWRALGTRCPRQSCQPFLNSIPPASPFPFPFIPRRRQHGQLMAHAAGGQHGRGHALRLGRRRCPLPQHVQRRGEPRAAPLARLAAGRPAWT